MPRDALGSDPLEGVDGAAVLDLLPPRRRRTGPDRDEDSDEPEDRSSSADLASPDVALAASTRGKLTVRLPVPLLEQTRDAVYWTPGLTLVDLVTAALRRELAHREEQRGQPFEQRPGELPTGRPVG